MMENILKDMNGLNKLFSGRIKNGKFSGLIYDF